MSTNSNKIIVEANNYSLVYVSFEFDGVPATPSSFSDANILGSTNLTGSAPQVEYRVPRNGFVNAISYSAQSNGASGGTGIDVRLRTGQFEQALTTMFTVEDIIIDISPGVSDTVPITEDNSFIAGEILRIDLQNSSLGSESVSFIITVELALLGNVLG